MNIAVFSDVHGRILLCFKLVERYQRETGEHIDLILQCGDMGIYPDISNMDKATKRHADTDVSELGFHHDFTEIKSEVQEVLEKLSCDLICVRGNHEDHEYLDDLEKNSEGPLFAVDCYRRIHVLKTGVPYCFETDDSTIDILGIGRIGKPHDKVDNYQSKHIQEYEKERLNNLSCKNIDVLLTHDAARDFINTGFGMVEIREILNQFKPVYHFFGHTGQPFEKMIDENDITVSSKMSDFEWEENDRGKFLKNGCFGLLTWKNKNDHKFEVIKEKWLKEYNPFTWRYL